MKEKKEICVLCAWRETCNRKFSISGRDIRCPDFVKDLNIKEETPVAVKQKREVKNKLSLKSFAADEVNG